MTRYLLPPIIVLVTLGAYWPGLHNEFLTWDDDHNFLLNENFGGLSWNQLKWNLITVHMGCYQPLAWTLLSAQCSLVKLQPMLYHLTSVILHAVNSLVFYLLTIRLLHLTMPRSNLGRQAVASPQLPDDALRWGAAFAALLFAIHPLRVEAVAWISCQPYLPAALFFMLSVRSYLRTHTDLGAGAARRTGMLMVFVYYVLAVLCKAAAVSLPALLLLLDVYPLRRLPDPQEGQAGFGRRWFGPRARRVWLEKLPFLVPAFSTSIMAVVAKIDHKTVVPLQEYGVIERLAQAAYGFCFYLAKTVLPLDLSPYYVLPATVRIWDGPFFWSVVGFLAIVGVIVVLRHRWPAATAVLAAYLILLSPNIHIVRIGLQIAADRYSYISMLGWWVLAGAGLAWCWRSWRAGRMAPFLQATVNGLAFIVIVTLIPLTRQYVRVWHDSKTFWSHALAMDSTCGIAALNMGNLLLDEDRTAEAIVFYRMVADSNPTSFEAHLNLGNALTKVNQPREAAEYLERAVALIPDNVDALDALGCACLLAGDHDRAIQTYSRRAQIRPDNAIAFNDLAAAWQARGELQKSEQALRWAVRCDPTLADAHYSLGLVLIQKGQTADALIALRDAIRLQPALAAECNRLGKLLLEQDRRQEAQELLKLAAQFNPAPAAQPNPGG